MSGHKMFMLDIETLSQVFGARLVIILFGIYHNYSTLVEDVDSWGSVNFRDTLICKADGKYLLGTRVLC